MKMKMFSLVLIAILAISAIGTVSAANDPKTYSKGLMYTNGDASTINGRYIDIIAYDINNKSLGHYHDQGKWGKNCVLFPSETDHIDIDVAVWKVNPDLTNGRWNHVFTRHAFPFTSFPIEIKDYPLNSEVWSVNGRSIWTSGTVYGSSASSKFKVNCFMPKGDVHYLS
jgi:hypothetical protein